MEDFRTTPTEIHSFYRLVLGSEDILRLAEEKMIA
jgi:hypothetical protein